VLAFPFPRISNGSAETKFTRLWTYFLHVPAPLKSQNLAAVAGSQLLMRFEGRGLCIDGKKGHGLRVIIPCLKAGVT